jgi:hypothetical protein
MAPGYVPPIVAPTAPPAPRPPEVPKKGQIAYDITFLDDFDGTLAEFEELQKVGFMAGDSTSILGALRVFEKYKLVARIGDQRLVCDVGRSRNAFLRRDTDDGGSRRAQELEVKVQASRLGKSIVLSVDAAHDGRMKGVETVLDELNNKTAVMRLDRPAGDENSLRESKPTVYVIVTPRWVK